MPPGSDPAGRRARREVISLDPYGQSEYGVRFDWGLQGAGAISSGAAVVVVVDVLSFTTTLSVACDLGVDVFPFRSPDTSAASFAASQGAVLAVGRRTAGATGISLSPVSIRRAAGAGGVLAGAAKLVLPSPNGAAICRHLAEADTLVVGASLRNAAACARWVATAVDGAVAVVAAGERWSGSGLRPAVEDLWGAGYVIDALAGLGVASLSPEAVAARAAFRSLGSAASALAGCESGRELAADGYAEELAVAAEVDGSLVVPVLTGDMFSAA